MPAAAKRNAGIINLVYQEFPVFAQTEAAKPE